MGASIHVLEHHTPCLNAVALSNTVAKKETKPITRGIIKILKKNKREERKKIENNQLAAK